MDIPPHLLVYHADGRLERFSRYSDAWYIAIPDDKSNEIICINIRKNQRTNMQYHNLVMFPPSAVVHSSTPNSYILKISQKMIFEKHNPSQDWYEHVRTLWKSPVHCVTRKVMEFYFGG
jgi:hypothetical protein